jgi:hypothetical protein
MEIHRTHEEGSVVHDWSGHAITARRSRGQKLRRMAAKNILTPVSRLYSVTDERADLRFPYHC